MTERNPDGDPGGSAPAERDPGCPAAAQRDPGRSAPAQRDSVGRDRPVLLAATPDAETVVDRIRTLAVLAGVLGPLVALIAAELLVRIRSGRGRTGTERESRPIRRRTSPYRRFHFRFRARF
ncbi:hypothetical protein [Halorubrum sp. BOL3-1]|uniref:hypothetical protein n=1 Tax=Halorubrum sp. BOL3-1 TaxID=2497325 RepID=UPI001F501C58|nr:hypothetical protein [Halorubrum sp. BOL3-1]